jgi:hypothetical protein
MSSRRRFEAPVRQALDPGVFARWPLSSYAEFAPEWLSAEWPSIGTLLAGRALEHAVSGRVLDFAAQTIDLLADGLHYEQRIATRGLIATRMNWHDLFNAAVWRRWSATKSVLNALQCRDIERVGPRERTRAQCAATHFDEGGVIVLCSDPELVRIWDTHDWGRLFVEHADAFGTRIEVCVFGHALLEHALRPEQLYVGKAVCVALADEAMHDVLAAIRAGEYTGIDRQFAAILSASDALADPQNLRPLPISGIPGVRDDQDAVFYREAECFRPLRPGRTYPAPLQWQGAAAPQSMCG